MSGALLIALLRVSGELSLALLLILALRPLLSRAFGAGSAYAAWGLVPVLILVAQLPSSRPGVVLHRMVISDAAQALTVAPARLDDGFEGLARALLLVWVLGAATVLTVLTRRQRRFASSLEFDFAGNHWRAPAGSGPALLGVLRPRLCLPADFEQSYTPSQQALIRAHEDVHRRRGDNVWNLLAALLCALQWFNPLAWMAARALRVDQELSCDETVLRAQPAQAADYAHALLQAQGITAHGLPWASWRTTHPLIERIAMLKTHAHARRKSGLVVLLTLGLLGAGGVHALQSEEPMKDADVKLDLNLEFRDTVADKRISRKLETALALRSKGPATLRLPGDAQAPEVLITVSAEPAQPGQWTISSEIQRDGKILGKPRLITANGIKALIEIGEKGPNGEDRGMISLAVTPTAIVKPQP
ncbi:MAG: hypothetical protein JO006_02980 [Paucibacter sp.]|nr:hypothetical protein [Roseateles sp.]